MDLTNLPTFEPGLNELMQQLTQFCEQFSIDRFEADDIRELLTDGETVPWIVGQLRQDNAELDAEKLTVILSAIQRHVGPPPESVEETLDVTESAEEAIPVEEAIEAPVDLSQVDLSQLSSEMEALSSMKLPRGVDMNQVKKIMESPQGALIADFGVYCQEQGIDIASMPNEVQLQELNNQWMATPRATLGGKTPAEVSASDPSLFALKKIETYRRDEPRIGRNDPCPCGSGKKYKKCCGVGK
ncbi:MAG: YecA family protein [Candidatus Zhuqueibacterota bacterium]